MHNVNLWIKYLIFINLPQTDKLQKRISIVIEHEPKKSYDVFCAVLSFSQYYRVKT